MWGQRLQIQLQLKIATTFHITTERRQHLNKAEVEPGITFLSTTENM